MYIDFKLAYNSLDSNKVFQMMKKFRILLKLDNLTEMTMKTMVCKVRIEHEMSEEFQVGRGLRRGEVISSLLFNLVLEKIIRQMAINPGGKRKSSGIRG